MRIGIEILLDPDMPKPELTPSPLAPDENIGDFLELYYGVDVEALNDWAAVTRFMRGSIGYVVQELENTDDFKIYLTNMYGSNWEKKVLAYQTMNIEQLYAFITGYSKLTSRMRQAWLDQFNSWLPSVLRAQVKGLTESVGFVEIEWAFGHRKMWRGGNLRDDCIQLTFPYCSELRWKLQKDNYFTTIS